MVSRYLSLISVIFCSSFKTYANVYFSNKLHKNITCTFEVYLMHFQYYTKIAKSQPLKGETIVLRLHKETLILPAQYHDPLKLFKQK